MASTDPQTLLAYGNCFNCYGNSSIGELMELALIDQIAQRIGVVVELGAVMRGSFDDPNGNVTPVIPSQGAIYYKDDAPTVNYWFWSVTNQNWFQAGGP